MLQDGALFAHYRIETELGAGGMGRVYRALDTRLQRRVALKVLLADPAFGQKEFDEASARMLREARAAAAFEHPSKVSIFEVGTHDGAPYIAMELVVGRPLRDFIGAGVPLETRLEWLVEVARVLGAAHAAGLVHRDVKPENVMIRDGGGVKVLDFGIARRATQPTDGEAQTLAASIGTLTGEGVPVGTPIYMAPEQLLVGKLDGRVDQFAWGTMAFELLTGRHPWLVGESLASAISAILAGEPPPLPRELGVPPGVSSAILRALAKKREDRFASCDDLIAALRSEPAIAAPRAEALPVPEPAAPRAEAPEPAIAVPHAEAPAPAPVAPPAEVSAVAAAPSVPAALAEPDTAPNRAVSAFTPPVTTRGGVVATLEPEEKRDTSGKRWPFGLAAAAFVAACVGWVVLRAPAKPAYEPSVGLATVERYRNLKTDDALIFESGSVWRAAADDFARAVADPGAPALWRAEKVYSEGQLDLVENRDQAALGKLERAVSLAPDFALAHVSLSGALARAGRLDDALQQAAEVERLQPKWWRGPAAAADANAYAGKLDAAIEDYRRALELAPENPLLLSELALVYHASHIDDQAEQLAHRSLELNPNLVSPHILLGERALEKGDGETALGEANRALSLMPQSLPARLAQGDALVLLKRDAEAFDAFRRAVSLWDKLGHRGPFADRMQGVTQALADGRLPSRGSSAGADAAPARSPTVTAAPAPSLPNVPPRSAVPAKPRAPRSPTSDFGDR